MDPIQHLLSVGLSFRSDGDRLIVSPASLLNDQVRALIRGHRTELLLSARASRDVYKQLVDSINQCCAVRGDDDLNRAELIAEAFHLTPEQQADMREHFDEQTAIFRGLPAPARRIT